MQGYLGIDVGSVTTKVVLIDAHGSVLWHSYRKTQGQPIRAIQSAFTTLRKDLGDVAVAGVGTTGSGRKLAAHIVGADTVKNEITAHAVSAIHLVPGVRTIVEIGGQDSKLILIRSGVVVDFSMNTVCAAGTGSFLEHQAARLGIGIAELGNAALAASSPARIAGRCTVFAESDMIHKQQMGHNLEDIVAGLCDALVRNYLNNLGRGKEIVSPVIFQGGVAANPGIKAAFEREVGKEFIVPPHYPIMGAIGAALLARGTRETKFRGFSVSDLQLSTSSFYCQDCPNSCGVIEISDSDRIIARWGDSCGKWGKLTE
ncbi:MAG: acyl-CoA dehydratase activase [Thermodesulfovibrionales bacterium]